MRLNKFDLNLLLALEALLRERSVTRAAERLFVSQPAMSAALAKLRDYFNDPLLVRVGRDLELTPRGRSLRDARDRSHNDAIRDEPRVDLPDERIARAVGAHIQTGQERGAGRRGGRVVLLRGRVPVVATERHDDAQTFHVEQDRPERSPRQYVY